MPDYTSETVTTVKHCTIIPAAEPWGAAAAEIGKAWAVAEHAYRDHFKVSNDQPLADNVLRFHVTDEAIVIEWQEEAKTT